MTCGVPQDSCLEPLFFSVYINDLHLSLNHSDVNMYADGTSISFLSNSISDINEKVNSDLLRLKTWMASNKLFLTVTKTQTILICGGKKLKETENCNPQNLQIIIVQEPVWKIKHIRYSGLKLTHF